MTDDKGMASKVIQSSQIILKKEVFSDQPRFTIMFLIYLNKTVGFTELQRLLKLTPGNLDHHIKKLARVGYVIMRKKFSWRPLNVVTITPKGAEAFREYTSNLKQMLKKIE
ncbi:MAG: transcriptional regulator [Promethearchaeota archaeon]